MPRQHIPALDGLRGCAVLLVIFVHANMRFAGSRPLDGALNRIASAGWVGVDLFFVLSGFLITGNLLDAKAAREAEGRWPYFRNFYARRALRIMPLYYGFLVVALWVLPRLLPEWGVGSRIAKLSLLLFWYNFWAAGNDSLGFHHVFWSLSVEEHFYLIWPLVIWLSGRRTAMAVCACFMGLSLLFRVAVVASGAWLQMAYLATPCRFDGLAAGALIALSFRERQDWDRLVNLARPALLLSSVVLMGVAVYQGHFADYVDLRRNPAADVDSSAVLTVGISALSVFFGSLLVILIEATDGHTLRRVMENPVLRSVGKYSFGMYVFHMLVLYAIALAVRKVWSAAAFDSPVRLALIACVTCATYALARASYHLYEDRFLRLKERFEHRGERQPPPLHDRLSSP